MMTRGEGVKKSQHFDDIINGSHFGYALWKIARAKWLTAVCFESHKFVNYTVQYYGQFVY